MDIKLRKATTKDIPLLIQLRIDFIVDEAGAITQEQETAIRSQMQTYFTKHIPEDTCIVILAEADGKAVSTAYLSIFEKPAHISSLTGVAATVYNVLTYPSHRRKGIATKVVTRLIEEAKKTNISRIHLSATESGLPVYEKLGFKKSSYTEMSLKI
ncbi:MAG: GNAT family N-acetyltransferase [Defluviitaleaceae bacterium]|nr:GNAT family N-acetyltransferase [Defluviitaleaceae bacterium]